MRNFNEFSALWRAPIFQRAFYVDVGQNWKGIGLRYLCMVVLLTWGIALLRVTIGFSNFLQNEAPAGLRDFPTIIIARGRASSPVEQPYIYKDEHGKRLFAIDTTGQTNRPTDLGVQMLLTATEIIQDQNGVIQRHSLSEFPDVTINEANLLRWGATIRDWMFPVGLVVMFVLDLGYRLLAALVYALIGLAFNAGLGASLSFGKLMRLSIFCMTTVMFIDTVAWLFQLDTGCYTWLLYPALTLVYLFFAIKFNADAQLKAMVYDPGAVPAGPQLPLQGP